MNKIGNWRLSWREYRLPVIFEVLKSGKMPFYFCLGFQGRFEREVGIGPNLVGDVGMQLLTSKRAVNVFSNDLSI